MTFEDDLKAAQQKPRRTADVVVTLAGNTHAVRLTAMSGIDWAEATVRHPLRPGVAFDAQYGYNVHGLVRAEFGMASLVSEDGDKSFSEADWHTLLDTLDGGAAGDVVNTVFTLNEFASDEDVKSTKKALDSSLKYLASLSNSESTPAGLTGGSPASSPSASTKATE